jgi:hypothetical protein
MGAATPFAPPELLPADQNSPLAAECGPKLSPTRSGIAAHCDPTSHRDLAVQSVAYHHPEMHMSIRTAKCVSAVLAGILLATPHGAAHAADECLSGPKKDQTPQGGHWYYRIDHATKRHCWYLGEERARLSQTTPSNSSQSAKPASPDTEPAIQPSIANARAELPSLTRIEQPIRADLPASALPANAAGGDNKTDVAGAQTGRSVVATRWPDTSNETPSTSLAPASRDADAAINATNEPSSLAAGQLATADAPSITSTYSVTMQLAAALMAALALAGIIGSAIFKLGGTRRPAPAKIRAHRGAIWEPTDDNGIHLIADSEMDPPPRRRGFARDLDRARDRNNRNNRIADFFSQLTKRRPT